MKICLVFTPFHRPNSVPFGISYLKSYLERNIPNISVKNLDLNVLFFDRIVKRGQKGLCKHCLSNNTSCSSIEGLIISGEIKKICAGLKKRPSTKKEYDSYISNIFIFEQFYKGIVNCYSYFLKYFIEQDIFPDVLSEALLEDSNRILAEKPDIIGFSILVNNNLLYSLALAKIIKSKTDIPVIFGGAVMAHLDIRELLTAFNFIDFIFHGESEVALKKFIILFHLKKFDTIPNLAYRDSRHIQINEREYVNNLDIIPFPDFSDFDLENYICAEKVLPILSSRGCYWRRCAFCTHNLPYSNHVPCNYRSVKNVVDELEVQRVRFKIRHFLFVDEAISPKRLGEISEEISARNIRIYYGVEGIRPENNLSYDLLNKAYNSGLRWVYLGVESTTQRLLDKMDKGTNVGTVRKIIKNCYKIGIRPFISYIIGFPSQTEEELRKECVFLREHSSSNVVEWTPFKLNKGSPIFSNPDKYGVVIGSQQVLFKIKDKIVHSTSFNFTINKGLTTDMAMEIVNSEEALKEQSRFSFDEITNVMLGAAKFKRSFIDLKKHYSKSFVSSTIKTSNVIKSKIVEDYYYRFLLGITYEKLGRFKKALAEFEKIQNKKLGEKFRARIHLRLGEYYEITKRYDSAIGSYEKAIKIFPNEGVIYLSLGRVYFILKKYKEAIRKINKAIELRIKGGNIHFLLGCCYERVGQYKKAIKELQNGEKIDPENAQISFLLSKCYRNIGQTDQSNRELDKVVLKSR
jgi:radical SAM superfamily enzyme YgiQ (UPF0313 family)/Flp pilus assembly protein TadD